MLASESEAVQYFISSLAVAMAAKLYCWRPAPVQSFLVEQVNKFTALSQYVYGVTVCLGEITSTVACFCKIPAEQLLNLTFKLLKEDGLVKRSVGCECPCWGVV